MIEFGKGHYARLVVSYGKEERYFLVNANESITLENPEHITKIYIDNVQGEPYLSITQMNMPALRKFISFVPVRGLDDILASTKYLTRCNAKIWVQPGEWFIMPELVSNNIFLEIYHGEGCFDFGDSKAYVSMNNRSIAKYIKGPKTWDKSLGATVVEYDANCAISCEILISKGKWQTRCAPPTKYESQQDYLEQTGHTIWEYLGVRHYSDSRAKSARSA